MTHGCRMLLLLANFGKESKPEPIIAKISQETLAEMIGTTRSRVSFFMNKFRELGFIAYNGGVEKRHRSSQLIVECRSARPAANQDLICSFRRSSRHRERVACGDGGKRPWPSSSSSRRNSLAKSRTSARIAKRT